MQATAARIATRKQRGGFTLIEILTVIVIIGILAALLIPAVQIAVRRAKLAAMRAEVNGMSQAIDAYQAKYGDYPPDFSDWALVLRHYRKVFPNIQATELSLLTLLTSSGVSVDRSEALVWALGGFSSDPEKPFTGVGGPLTTTSNGDSTYNTERDNALFDFPVTRLDLNQSASNGVVSSSDGDLFPSFGPNTENSQPYVYFDSRTYLQMIDTDGNGAVDDYNGFFPGGPGNQRGVRPYASNEPSSSGIRKFINWKTFQLIGPGLDGQYGSLRRYDDGSALISYYFEYPTGKIVTVSKQYPLSSNPGPTIGEIAGSNGYLESSYYPPQIGASVVDNFHLDNVANFSSGSLEDDIAPSP